VDVLMERIDWRVGDMLDKGSLERALEGISVVINCAAIVSFNPRDRIKMIAQNVSGTQNLAEAIQEKDNKEAGGKEGARTLLIHISSIAALGDGPGTDPAFLIDENTPRDPRRRHSGYSESKFESEKILNTADINAVILNPGVILGPGQWTKGSSLLFAQAWQGLKYYPYGGTGYVDVRDVAGIITKIGEEPGLPGLVGDRFCVVGANLRYREFFNLVTNEYGKRNPHIYARRSMTELAWRADAIRAILTRREPLLTRETAEAAQRISYYSANKIRHALNFEFRPVEETIDWVAGCFKKFAEH
jgi:nucleoside-diphosphate-sugar epimerase